MKIKLQDNGINRPHHHITLESHEAGIDIRQGDDCILLDYVYIDTMIKNLETLKQHIKANL